MMKTLGRLLSVAIIALMASCATGVPPKKASEDCLVLIRTTLVNKENTPVIRAYHFKLNMGYGTVNVGNRKEDFMMIMVHEPGVKIIGITSDVSGNDVYGQSQETPVNIDLPYERGGVIVADFTFTRTLERVEERRYVTKPAFEMTSEESKAAVLEEFRKRGGAQSWL